EEEVLFPTLEKKGFSTTGGPLGVMLIEHDRGRSLIQELSEASEGYKAGDQDSGERWIEALFDYSQLMHDHFVKEEDMLFRMADNVLSPEEQAAIVLDFERIEREKLGPGRHKQLSEMMNELVAQKT
ncbi:MAG: hemerythrin domain-containing protein, partial [Acidobacteriota bacterium]|nr:hemerythrin domain-containing protein [Acidobacteriota bacterium]